MGDSPTMPPKTSASGRALLSAGLLACWSATLQTSAMSFKLSPNPIAYVPSPSITEVVRSNDGQPSLYSGMEGGVRMIAKGRGLRTADGSFGGGVQVYVGSQPAAVVEFLSSSEQIVFDSPPMEDRQNAGSRSIKVRGLQCHRHFQ